nr:protein FAR1-RELATED SEQUENCE 5-like [Ipomoea batatas]
MRRVSFGIMDAMSLQTDCTVTYTSNNTKLWAPNCEDSITPYLGQVFGTVEQGEVFYFEYARAVGFDVRRSTVKKDRIALVGEDRDRMVIVGNAVQSLKETLSVDVNSAPVRRGKRSVIENFCGNVVAEPVVIRPPVVARNKGRRKRLKGARGIAVALKKQGGRTCATCGKANGHDSRNCELRENNPESEGWF